MKIEGKVLHEGYAFERDSQRKRWIELKRFEDAGEISKLKAFSEYPLTCNGVSLGRLKVDFEYFSKGNNSWFIEFTNAEKDDPAVIALKKKLFRANYPNIVLRQLNLF